MIDFGPIRWRGRYSQGMSGRQADDITVVPVPHFFECCCFFSQASSNSLMRWMRMGLSCFSAGQPWSRLLPKNTSRVVYEYDRHLSNDRSNLTYEYDRHLSNDRSNLTYEYDSEWYPRECWPGILTNAWSNLAYEYDLEFNQRTDQEWLTCMCTPTSQWYWKRFSVWTRPGGMVITKNRWGNYQKKNKKQNKTKTMGTLKLHRKDLRAQRTVQTILTRSPQQARLPLLTIMLIERISTTEKAPPQWHKSRNTISPTTDPLWQCRRECLISQRF